jgi:hypothetical protein
MSTLPLTKRNLDPHCRRFLTGNGAAWFKATHQNAMAPTKSLLDRHSKHSTVPQTPPARARQPRWPRPPTATILTATVKSP